MEVATTRRTSVALRDDVAQALWAAMMDDDDLASDYADRAIIKAITELVALMPPSCWGPKRFYHLMTNLEEAREAVRGGMEEMAERWHRYTEPPF